jgi:hypothetical protein
MILSRKLKVAMTMIKDVHDSLTWTPAMDIKDELIDLLLELDGRYQDFCWEADTEMLLEKGTTYEQGINLEFYIEASDWHRISKMIRKFK